MRFSKNIETRCPATSGYEMSRLRLKLSDCVFVGQELHEGNRGFQPSFHILPQTFNTVAGVNIHL